MWLPYLWAVCHVLQVFGLLTMQHASILVYTKMRVLSESVGSNARVRRLQSWSSRMLRARFRIMADHDG